MSGLLLAAVLAATPITLDEARTEGRRNVQALQSLLDVESARGDVRASRSTLLPQVNFSGNAGVAVIGRQRVFTTVPDATTGGFVNQSVEVPGATRGNFSLEVDLNQSIYDRARWKTLEQSGARLESTQGQAQEQSATSELEAIRRFFELFRSQATIQVLQATVKRSEEQVERAQAMFQAGRVGRSEEISARVNLGNDRISVARQQSQIAITQAQLATWLARPGASDLAAVDPGFLGQTPAPAPALDEALSEAHRNRPLLRALERQVRAADLGISIAHAGYLPSLSATGSYQRQGPSAGPVFTEPRLQNNLFGSVVLSWNLFNGFNTGAQVDKAEAARRKAELTYQQTGRELDGDVRQSLETLKSQLEAARLAADNREAAVLGLQLSEERFRAGAGSTLEVRDAQLKLTQAELSLLTTRIDVEIARYTLLRAMGTLSPGESR